MSARTGVRGACSCLRWPAIVRAGVAAEGVGVGEESSRPADRIRLTSFTPSKRIAVLLVADELGVAGWLA